MRSNDPGTRPLRADFGARRRRRARRGADDRLKHQFHCGRPRTCAMGDDHVVLGLALAVEMGGGPAVVYGAKVLEAYDQNTSAGA